MNRRNEMVESIMRRTDMLIKELPSWIFRYEEV